MRKIEKVAIANRGEVAVRIIRACQEMGLETVLLHSAADVSTMAYRLSDEQVCIGGALSSESYLNIENNIQGALSAGCDAIHPGFGFLSENAEFARACLKNRMIFIGPDAQSIDLFGDKISAKKLVQSINGPLLAGYQGDDQKMETLISQANEIGYPLMVKAAAGGGGRGIRIIHQPSECENLILSAKKEALSSFGSEHVFLEKYLGHAKHIEVQIFGDATGRIHHLYERECSVQRKHQKVIEEAPCPSLPHKVREKMLHWAVKIAEAAQYKGAGTVEFLYQDNEFYFLEMNTRLQVEHPVTEMVLGVDLVKAQLITAQDRPLIWGSLEENPPRGHAIECRLYAEDPYQKGLPSTGEILGLRLPHGPGRRFELGFEAGDEVTSYYDSMIAKVVVWDENRPRAIKKMLQTLSEMIIFGVKTNQDYLMALLKHPEFQNGEMTTAFIEQYFPEGLEPIDIDTSVSELLKNLYETTPSSASIQNAISNDSSTQHPSPWVSLVEAKEI